jgi:hypothetical protein
MAVGCVIHNPVCDSEEWRGPGAWLSGLRRHFLHQVVVLKELHVISACSNRQLWCDVQLCKHAAKSCRPFPVVLFIALRGVRLSSPPSFPGRWKGGPEPTVREHAGRAEPRKFFAMQETTEVTVSLVCHGHLCFPLTPRVCVFCGPDPRTHDGFCARKRSAICSKMAWYVSGNFPRKA